MVATRPLARLAAGSAPAMSTWAMIHPPNTSPWALESAGIGITRRAGMPGGSLVWLLSVMERSCLPGIRTLQSRAKHKPSASPLSMRRTLPPLPDAPANQGTRNDWATLKTLLPYLWAYKWRMSLALVFLVSAKLANVGVPLVLKQLIDSLTITASQPQALLALPLGLLLAYGALRLSTTVFTEL